MEKRRGEPSARGAGRKRGGTPTRAAKTAKAWTLAVVLRYEAMEESERARRGTG